MTWYSYSIFGMQIQADYPIPGLYNLGFHSHTDLNIWVDGSPEWVHEANSLEKTQKYISAYNANSKPVWELWESSNAMYWYLQYYNDTVFILNRNGTHISVEGYQEKDINEMFSYLVSLVFGLVLRLRGTVSLHASAISIDNCAVAIIGSSGAGKSTTVTAFALQGYGILSDEIVTLEHEENQFFVHPAYPRVRLSEKSLQMLGGTLSTISIDGLSASKKYVDIRKNGFHFEADAKSLSAIYFLRERNQQTNAPFIEAMTVKEGLIELISNSYPGHLLDTSMRRYEMDTLSMLVKQVPMRGIVPSSHPEKLTNLCSSIIEDFWSISKSSDSSK